MKKIFIYTLMIAMTVPAMADEVPVPEQISIASGEVAVAEMPEIKATTNPAIKFPHGMQIGVGVSATSGLNGFVGYANKNFDSFWLKRFGLRLDFASTQPVKSLINDGIDSIVGDDGIDIGDDLTIKDATIKAHHAAALVDFYPFGNTWFLGGIRLTGGYYFGKLNLDANVTGNIDGLPDGEFAFSLGNEQYKYSGNSVHGTAHADWKYKGPYVGAGFDLGIIAGFKIYMDAGVVFTDKAAQLDLDLPTDNLQRWDGAAWQPVDLAGIAEFERAKHDALADAQDELDDLKFYPMVKIGFMYRF